jgi:DNA-binding transcriptional ArsR family regulator
LKAAFPNRLCHRGSEKVMNKSLKESDSLSVLLWGVPIIYIFAPLDVLEMVEISVLDIDRLETAAGMLKSIAHPMRIAILNLLEGGKKMTVTEIYEKLGIEQSSTSHHLGILRDKGVLSSRRDGKNTWYYLKNETLSKILECIDTCSHNQK